MEVGMVYASMISQRINVAATTKHNRVEPFAGKRLLKGCWLGFQRVFPEFPVHDGGFLMRVGLIKVRK